MISASPETLQLCREVVQTLTPDINAAYADGFSKGLEIGVLLMLSCVFMVGAIPLVDFVTEIIAKCKKRKLQQSSLTGKSNNVCFSFVYVTTATRGRYGGRSGT